MALRSSFEVPSQACHLSTARDLARQLLDRSPANPREKDDVLLVVGEMCGNVVCHARLAAHDCYLVDIEIDSGCARITVTDRGRGFDRGRVSKPAWDKEGGRGLWLIESLSDDVRYEEPRGGGCSISASVPIGAGEARTAPPERFDETASEDDEEAPAGYLFSGG